MKKQFLLILIVTLMFISTGCVKLDYDIDINKDNQVSITETKELQYDTEMTDDFMYLLESNISKYVNSYKELGYDVTFQSKNDFAKVKLKKKGLPFNYAYKYLPIGFDRNDKTSFVEKKGLIKNVYKIHLKYLLKDVVRENIKNQKYFESSMGLLNSDLADMVVTTSSELDPVTGHILFTTKHLNGRIDVGTILPMNIERRVTYEPTLRIKIPAKVKNHNANKVLDNNVYEWVLQEGDAPIEIYIEYEVVHLYEIFMIITLIIAFVFVMSLVRKLNDDEPVNGL